ncbi:hypothetical protein EKD04_005580 [Chloroflexales bacterium ZM16-3]|nr:hypothetical protein [Chloroflexales bacterium ZM16-3]
MSVTEILLRLARAVLDSVLKGLTDQLNTVEQAAMNPLKAMIQQVVGGAWQGKGADAFVEEVSSLLIPNVTTIQNHISTTCTNLEYARDVIERADEEVERLVKSRLFDAFSFY